MASVSSSTSTSAVSLLSAKTGIGGLISGMDLDELVYNLTATSRNKILKQQQNVQKLQWKQTAYRSVTTALKEFQSKYLDVLSSTNFKSTSFFKTVSASSSSDKVKVSATASASEGSIIIGSVTQLATNQTVKSTAAATKSLTGTNSVASIIAGLESGDSFRMSLDGKVKTITLNESFFSGLNETNFVNRLQGLVDSAFGTGAVTVGDSGSGLTFSATGSTISLYSAGTESTALADLGFENGQSSKLTTSAALESLPFAADLAEGDTFTFKINSADPITVNRTDTLSSVINKINSSGAGVKIAYSSITDRFTMTANESGAGNNIEIGDVTGNLMAVFGLTDEASSAPEVTEGKNAILTVNGQTITRSSNTIDIDGVQVTISELSETPTTITITGDSSGLMDTVKKFVEDYNAMVDLINGLSKEEVYSDYQPLSDEQKDEMSESEIKNWEEKAKSGLLRNDSILRTISSKLQSVMTGLSVNGTSLYSMGITSAGYSENGKLQIDETKLKKALETKSSDIRELFTSENGIARKLEEIINGATKTSGVKGSRGTLVEAAGVASTMSDTENTIYDQIKRINKSILTLQDRLTDEETRLWKKFTAMESALQMLNAQSALLTQFSSSGS